MILTVTLNPAIDFHIGIGDLTLGKNLTAHSQEFFAGGKGINVSRVLKNLGCDTEALSFIGGFTGDYILNQANDIVKPIYIKGINRINTKIKNNDIETEIQGVAPEISNDEFQRLCDIIKSSNPEVLVLSGSIPYSLAKDTYNTLAKLSNAKIIIDTRGEALKESLKLESIFLIKPNKDELGELFNCTVQSNEQALSLAQNIKKNYNIQNLIISLGSEGAYFLHDSSIYFSEAIKGELISSVGAGDSVIAGFLAKYQETQDSIDAFKYGIACGTGTAFSHGLCTLEKANKLYKEIKIKKLQLSPTLDMCKFKVNY